MMEDFYIDTVRDEDLLNEFNEGKEVISENVKSDNENQVEHENKDNDEEEDDGDDEGSETYIELDDFPNTPTKEKPKAHKSDWSVDLQDTYLITDYSKMKKNSSKNSKVDELLKNSVIQPGFETLKVLPMKIHRKKTLQKIRRKERSLTKGKEWFNLPATEVTEEIKNDLEILKMRSALDPKHVYKKNDIKVMPKYFQIGKVVEGPADYYCSRIPKSQRKRTIVEELLADSKCKQYQKRKYKEIIRDRPLRAKERKANLNSSSNKSKKGKKNKNKIPF